MSEACLVDVDRRVATITLNRPQKFNAFKLESYQATRIRYEMLTRLTTLAA